MWKEMKAFVRNTAVSVPKRMTVHNPEGQTFYVKVVNEYEGILLVEAVWNKRFSLIAGWILSRWRRLKSKVWYWRVLLTWKPTKGGE